MADETPQHIAFPPRIVNGQLATVAQGSSADIEGQVHLLCVTPQGWFPKPLDDFGLYPQQHLAGGPDVPEIQRQIDTYVPDAEAELDDHPELLDQALGVVGVRIGRSG